MLARAGSAAVEQPPDEFGGAELIVDDLRVSYASRRDPVVAVDGLTFTVASGEVLGLVGESGSGKSTAALAILRLLRPPGRIEGGRVVLDGVDLLTVDELELRRIRWRTVALIPQGSMNSLNPVMRAGDQIADAITAHDHRSDRVAIRSRVDALLDSVRLRRDVARRYPHELSGGMRQRVCIAMATALDPRLLIADEPTSALDVVVQRAVAETLLDARSRLGASLVLIGHDLALQAQMVDRMAVMRRGRLVEIGPVRTVFHQPVHPYTRMLLTAVPSIRDPDGLRRRTWSVRPADDPTRCFLGTACAQHRATPDEARALMHDVGEGHFVACPTGELPPGNREPNAHG
jgi:oligopeptide/dipeptide ABC transporter ATP-binding protein